MVAAPVASGWTGNNDGAGLGLSFTTPAGVTATQSLLVFIGSSSNADTITAPGTGTWADITLPDNVVTSSGGQYRAFECLNPASSTAYAFTMGATRRTLVWVLVDGADLTGGTMVSIASSLESAAAGTHAPPSVVPPASGLGVFDCLAFRQFNPDASSCTPPAAGLSWTELQDVRGLDVGGSGQNIQMAVNYAVADASGVAISTSPLNTVDTFEPALVIRVVLKTAAGGGSTVSAVLAATLPAPTAAATATPRHPATLAATLPAPVAAVTAQPRHPAVLVATLPAPVAAMAARPRVPALLAAALPAPTAAAVATLRHPAILAAVLPAPVAIIVKDTTTYATAVLTPGASAPATLTASAAAGGTLTPSTISPATLTPGSA